MHYIKASTVTNFGNYHFRPHNTETNETVNCSFDESLFYRGFCNLHMVQQKIDTRQLSAYICTDVRTDRPALSVNKYCQIGFFQFTHLCPSMATHNQRAPCDICYVAQTFSSKFYNSVYQYIFACTFQLTPSHLVFLYLMI